MRLNALVRHFSKLTPRATSAAGTAMPEIVKPDDDNAHSWMVSLRKENFFDAALQDPNVTLTAEQRDALTKIGSFRNASDRELFDRHIQDVIKQ